MLCSLDLSGPETWKRWNPWQCVLENTRLMWAWKHFELIVLCKTWRFPVRVRSGHSEGEVHCEHISRCVCLRTSSLFSRDEVFFAALASVWPWSPGEFISLGHFEEQDLKAAHSIFGVIGYELWVMSELMRWQFHPQYFNTWLFSAVEFLPEIPRSSFNTWDPWAWLTLDCGAGEWKSSSVAACFCSFESYFVQFVH